MGPRTVDQRGEQNEDPCRGRGEPVVDAAAPKPRMNKPRMNKIVLLAVLLVSGRA